MKRPIKIVLLAAAIIYAWSAASTSASPSEHRSLFSQTPYQSILSNAHSQGEPLAYPNDRQTIPGILQIDSLTDIELGDLQMVFSGIKTATTPKHGSKTGIGSDARNITLLLQRKKIIYPFHSFL